LINLVSKGGLSVQEIQGESLYLEFQDSYGRVAKHQLESLSLQREQERVAIRAQTYSDTAAQMVHDLRSPLSALHAVTRSSLSSVDTDSRKLIESVTLRIQDICQKLLERDKMERATFESMSSTTQMIHELILEKQILLQERSHTQKSKPVLLEFEDRNCPPLLQLTLSPNELRRILSNLIDNSMEASPHGGDIVVSTEDDGNFFRIKIRDHGIGIPEEQLPKLGLRGATFGKLTGHGLGLYSVMKLLESVGGSLQIDSAVNQGTTVELNLPKKKS
jgi:signal transduction histidine kinase